MTIAYHDPFVSRLCDDIGALLTGRGAIADIPARLEELASRNSPAVAAYRRRTRPGLGLVHTAFKTSILYHFADRAPARVFRSSGTSGGARAVAACSPRGLELMRASILAGARRHIAGDLDRPAIVRLVPSEAEAPEVIMAHGMETIAEAHGDRATSASVVRAGRLDVELATRLMRRACAERRPVVLLGGSFAFVHLLDALQAEGTTLALPPGSRAVDAGGFKGRSRKVHADELRAALRATLGIEPARCLNLFGMTELASQLYDAGAAAVGPLGERSKGPAAAAFARVRDPVTLEPVAAGTGLLEVTDLCILDRPHVVLTGDLGVATSDGVAVVGRAVPGDVRGCALSLEEATARHA